MDTISMRHDNNKQMDNNDNNNIGYNTVYKFDDGRNGQNGNTNGETNVQGNSHTQQGTNIEQKIDQNGNSSNRIEGGQGAAGRGEGAQGVKLKVQVDPMDSPVRLTPPEFIDDMDEGIGNKGFDLKKYHGTGQAILSRGLSRSGAEQQLVDVEPAPKPETIKQEEEEDYSLIKDGDSLVDKGNKHAEKYNAYAAQTVYKGQVITSKNEFGKPPTGPRSTYATGGYNVSGNKNLMMPQNQDIQPLHTSEFNQNGQNNNQNQSVRVNQNQAPREPSNREPIPIAIEKTEIDGSTNVVPSDSKMHAHQQNQENLPYGTNNLQVQENPNNLNEQQNPSQQGHIPQEPNHQTKQSPTIENQTQQPTPHQGSNPVLTPNQENPHPQPPAPMNTDQVQQPSLNNQIMISDVMSDDMVNSNIANLNDSLNDENPNNRDQNKKEETQSKMNNDFAKYVKDEAGMSIFAPPDIDYINRAGRAEASLMKYDSEVRSKYDKVVQGLQQVFSNVLKINISAEESTKRFKKFFQGFLPKAESIAVMYPYKKTWGIAEESKDMVHLQPPGNFKQLQGTFEQMKRNREEYSATIVASIKELKLEYQSKIVEENFFEEGIDKKGTIKMHKDIEEAFKNIQKRNKKCLSEYEEIIKKVAANKEYFEKNKKFKCDVFEDYMHYVRSVRKMWIGIVDIQKKILVYWKRVRKVEQMRVQALSNLLNKYFIIEEKMSTSTQNIKSLMKRNETLSPEAVANSIYNDSSLLSSPILESLDIPTNSIENLVKRIQDLKNKMPDIVEFSLWDYINPHTIVKNVPKPLRIFRTNENYLFVYEVPDRSEVPMDEPLYKIRVNNLIMLFDERNNSITFKSNAMLSFATFNFNLRDHKDASEVAGYVAKFSSNTSSDITKSNLQTAA